MRTFALLCLPVLLLAAAPTARAVPATPGEVLDALLARAAAADFEGYFELYTDDAVFLGTDARERWPIAEFRAYARPRFADGSGWTYVPLERRLERRGEVVWFDELLEGAALGPCRGTGVLVRDGGRWRVAHYSLTVLVPNEIVDEVVRLGRSAVEARTAP